MREGGVRSSKNTRGKRRISRQTKDGVTAGAARTNIRLTQSRDAGTPPIWPPRSYLYHLPPIGVGTPFVESLTGYIARLAFEHCLSPGTLIAREIVPRMTIHKDKGNGHSLLGVGHLINMMGVCTRDVRRIVEELTLRQDLEPLTLFRWANVVSDDNLCRTHRAWCPVCYHEAKEKDLLCQG